MASIGIIANPASGKDIRRLVSYATTIDNNEKVNICKRIVLAAQGMGVSDIVFMPDTFQIGRSIQYDLESDGVLRANIRLLDMEMDASLRDTVEAAARMEAEGVGCVVVLGGDGTSRAAAKRLVHTPMLPVSTGTNNVYPSMMEGTVAGMAAAAIALMQDPYPCCIKDKRIEVFKDGTLCDIALIDAVVSDDYFVGAKAIWNVGSIRQLMVTRCHPATIGFSAVAGVLRIINDTDDSGLAVTLGPGGTRILAPIAAGILETVDISHVREIRLGEDYDIVPETRCMIALDGEREVRVNAGETVHMRITRNGPWRVLPRAALQEAARLGMYRVPNTTLHE